MLSGASSRNHRRCGALLLLLLGTAGCDADLYQGLTERQANQALVTLREAGVRADKRRDGRGPRGASFVLTVPGAEETRALRILEERGLPRPAPPQGRSASVLPLPQEAQRQFAAELAEALGATLEGLPAVQEARVHLVLPEDDPLRAGPRPRPTAAVLLRLRAGATSPAAEVALLVSRATPGLEPADVAVVVAASASVAAPQALSRVGPLWVAPGSQRVANALLSLLFLLSAAVVLLLAWPHLRRRFAPVPPGGDIPPPDPGQS